jgi:uncharacterized membrane protein (DUF485 family)
MPVLIRLFFKAVVEVLLANRFVIMALFGLKTLVAAASVFLSAKLAGVKLGPGHLVAFSVVAFTISTILVTRAALKRMRVGTPRTHVNPTPSIVHANFVKR